MKINHIKLAFEYFSVGCGVIVSAAFGSWIPLMTTLLTLNFVDMLTGILKGGQRHEIGSRKLGVGIKKKVGQWILIVVANSIDTMVFDGLPVAKTGVVSFLIGLEGISIVENLALLGVPIPPFITKYLQQIRDDNYDDLSEKEPDVSEE